MNDKEVIIRERRLEKRQNERLKFRLIPNGQVSNISGQTNDLSCVGANCRMNKRIAELTRVDLTLDIIGSEVTFEGVVVRSEKISDQEYDTAIYFSEIDPMIRQRIDDFIHLKENNINKEA